ncbi:hypothetical protein O181_119652 [Austropuccinia psidii MF-1]|uniref:Uncharacterized protein n=1 Tax=Austropuccinia psidii MF-1 TaxID=1389203 RepID=A0A9Q3Q1M2_9BASI|nr:hypothetical protein [Austropuccinia psidii MF-1]
MPNTMHELAAAPPTNDLIQQVRYAYTPATAPHNHPSLCLPCLCSCRALMICLQCCHCMSSFTHPYSLAPLPCPHDFPPMLPPHVCPHPSLNFHTPATYHAYAPKPPSRYASYATKPASPSP